MQTYLKKITLAVLPLAGMLFTAPIVSAHDEYQEHQAEHEDLNAAHRAEHEELNAEHEAAHQYPMTARQHRRLNAEHQAEHQDLNAQHQDYHDFNN